MSSLIGVFLLSLALAFLLTPLVARAAIRWRIIDKPSDRKVHVGVIPRAGGVAVGIAFLVSFAAAIAALDFSALPQPIDERTAALIAGGLCALTIGLWDDVRGLGARWKLAAQIGVAALSYAGGIQIGRVYLPGVGDLAVGWLSLPLTVFWFLLVLNALNLIDGLDGLASGITMFVALTLLIVWDTPSNLVVALALAALAGAALGFLRYNFHPASIFLGDSGSYFLGYNLAALSVLGSLKSEAAVAILIPIIALGVPVIDALWAPVRRFMLGQRIFTPDRDHIHHRLLKLGYTHRRAVLLLYGITLVMGLFALSLVHARDDRAALVLTLVGSGVILGIRWLGYLPFLHRARVVGWLGTVSDELGLRRSRRSFLECQSMIASAGSLEHLWAGIAAAAQFLKLDACELRVEPALAGPDPLLFRHRRDGAALHMIDRLDMLRISLPVVDGDDRLGALTIRHEVGASLTDRYLLRRVDQLHGSIAETLRRLRRAPGSTAPAAAAGSRMRSRLPHADILFLSHYFPPEGNAPASRVHALSRHWVRTGASVRVVTCAPNVPHGAVYDGYRNALWQWETIDGIAALRVWTYLAPNQGTVRRILNFLSYMVSASLAGLALRRPDVVIATSPQFFCGWAGVAVSRLRGVPFILEIRDIWPESIVTVGAMRNARLVRALEWLERRMYAAADHIVTVGDGYREQLCGKGVPTEKITVISNGVDQDAFEPRAADPAVRQRWGLGKRFVCAYVGTIGMASGLDVVLRTAQRLAERGRGDIHFLIVGDGAVRAELEAEVARSGLDTVTFTGRLDKAMVPAVLATVDACLVHLKKRDLFTTVMPSKIFEAAAMAKPIILGVEGHAADLVRRAGCGTCIEPENEAELCAAVERMADDPDLVAALGQAGRSYFVGRYDRRALANDYLGLIRWVCEGRMAQAPVSAVDPVLAGGASAALRPHEPALAAARRDAHLPEAPQAAGRA
jgi:UDP-N-acetylmuramyl pentapeptide phosphotransferase/UDP-N-acetylglucosamine-1-phosphate transferase/glycosyltransferase involved in cell wall biosynthesis